MLTPPESNWYAHEQDITKTLLQFSYGWILRSQASEAITQRAIAMGREPGPYLSLLRRVNKPGYPGWTLNHQSCVIDLGFTQISLLLRSCSVQFSTQVSSLGNENRIFLELIFNELPPHQGFMLEWTRGGLPWINGLPVFGVTVESLHQRFSLDSSSQHEATMILPRALVHSVREPVWLRVPTRSLVENMITSIAGLPPASRFIDEWEARSPLSSPPSELGRVSSEELRGELGESVERSLQFPLAAASNATQLWFIESSEDFLEATVTRSVARNGDRPCTGFSRIPIADLEVFTYKRSLSATTRQYLALKLNKALSSVPRSRIHVGENFLILPGLTTPASPPGSSGPALPARILLDTEDYVWIMTCADELIRQGEYAFSYTMNEPDLNSASDFLMRSAVQLVTAPRDPASRLAHVRRLLDRGIFPFPPSPSVTMVSPTNGMEAIGHLIHAEIAERLRAAEAMRSPTICRGCKYHCGQTNNGRTLVCAVHPNGPAEPDSCVDFETST